MSISRWKIMAGMFGVSLAGIYALAAPGTKMKAETKGAPVSNAVVFMEPPLVVPASGVLPITPPAELVIPAAPVEPPSLPMTFPADLPTPPPLVLSVPDAVVPIIPTLAEVCPAPVLVAQETSDFTMPSSITLPRAVTPPTLAPIPIVFHVPSFEGYPATPVTTPQAPEVIVTPAQPKFRIVLRLGEGEPVFEVRTGDNLVMKVVSEKVDVKAPLEKGQTLSAVKAMGKVRFVGFGAEGACEELSFLAGTGEVSLAGTVKVQVKDKLGRVETELTGEKMNYRLDASTSSLAGGLEP